MAACAPEVVCRSTASRVGAAVLAVASFGLERAATGFAVLCLHAPAAIICGADEPP